MVSLRRIRGLVATLAVLALAARVVRTGFPLGRYVVDGPSMEPAYHAGDRVLVNRLAYVRHEPAIGDVVVLRDPERRGHHLLKRVAHPPEGIGGHGGYFVRGDNAAESRDSRSFGVVRKRDVVGKAWRRY